MVGLVGVFVEVDGDVVFDGADLHRVHGGFDRRPGVCLGDAIALDDLLLGRGDAAAVAAHGRNQKRFEADGLEFLDQAFDNKGDIGDAAAADGDGHGLARFNLGGEIQSGHFLAHGAGNILQGRCLEVLADAHHARERHGFGSC